MTSQEAIAFLQSRGYILEWDWSWEWDHPDKKRPAPDEHAAMSYLIENCRFLGLAYKPKDE